MTNHISRFNQTKTLLYITLYIPRVKKYLESFRFLQVEKKKEKRKEIRMQEEQKLLTFDSLLNSFQ